MIDVANAINSFGQSPKADIVQADDPILEIPLSEFQGLLEEMVLTHNQIAEMSETQAYCEAGSSPRWSPGPRIASRPQDHPWRSYNYSMPISGSF